MVEELRAAGRAWPATAWDFPAHGGSYLPDPPFDWWDFAGDVLSVVEDGPAVGVGHSCGGASLAMAEVLSPGTFAGLVLVEPIVFPPPFGRVEDVGLAERAERRRECFSSPEEAREHLASRETFAHWDARALDGYLRGGFGEGPDGWCLRCPPWAEAEVYRGAGAHGAWDRLGEVEPPVLLLAGELSESHPSAFLEELAGRFRRAETVVVPGAGHLLPMERPDRVAELVGDFVEGLG